jgi:hypothetical protein
VLRPMVLAPMASVNGPGPMAFDEDPIIDDGEEIPPDRSSGHETTFHHLETVSRFHR